LQTLQFQSAIRHYGIKADEQPHSARIGRLRVLEMYSSVPDPDMPPGIHDYQLCIEADVSNREEVWQAGFEAADLAEGLDRSWVYVCGEPLHPVISVPRLYHGPAGWSGNSDAIIQRLARGDGVPFAIGSPTIKARHWMHIPLYPLKHAIEVSVALESAPESLSALVELHHTALNDLGTSSRLFNFAKGMELARRLLPGENDRSRHAALPSEIQRHLQRSLGWLFDMANNRFEMRHVVRDPDRLHLHPRMTSAEFDDFHHDADLILRTVVCLQLGRPPFVVTRAEGPSAGPGKPQRSYGPSSV